MQFVKMLGLASVILATTSTQVVFATDAATKAEDTATKVEDTATKVEDTATKAEDTATATEVVSKVQAAAAMLKEKGAEEGIKAFLNKDGSWNKKNEYVWGGTYVFAYDCKADKALAHPTLMDKPSVKKLEKEGKLVMAENDMALFEALCEAGEKKPNGGWVSYQWPKPDAKELSQKVSYALQVEGSSIQVSAGIYDDAAKVEKLDKMLAK